MYGKIISAFVFWLYFFLKKLKFHKSLGSIEVFTVKILLKK